MSSKTELLYLNAFYLFSAIIWAKLSRFRIKRLTYYARKCQEESTSESTENQFTECVFIIWNCLYIATLLCILWLLVYQMQFANIKYLCSWFVVLQLVFYSSFLISYLVFMDKISGVISTSVFPLINALAWIVSAVCLSEGQGYTEFQDFRYFAVHILPTIAAIFHEIYIYNFSGFVSSANKSDKTNQLRIVWTIYSPALILTLYALKHDPFDVYNHQLRPPNPWFVTVVGVCSNARLVYFPLNSCMYYKKKMKWE